MELMDCIIGTGWIALLVDLLRCGDVRLSLVAGKVLLNMDRACSDVFDASVYVLHPLQSDATAAGVDVVFVHGLRGGEPSSLSSDQFLWKNDQVYESLFVE